MLDSILVEWFSIQEFVFIISNLFQLINHQILTNTIDRLDTTKIVITFTNLKNHFVTMQITLVLL